MNQEITDRQADGPRERRAPRLAKMRFLVSTCLRPPLLLQQLATQLLATCFFFFITLEPRVE